MNTMTTTDYYRCGPRAIRGFIIECFEAGLVPFVKAPPGVGKSSIYKSVSNELQLQMIDHRISTSDQTDFSGLPQFVNGRARFAPFDELFPIEGTPIPTGKQGWCVFLDEFNSGTKPVMAASYKTILDKMIGQHPLHPNVVIGLAGNRDIDRAIVNVISTALQSRVIHLEMEVVFREWLEDVALVQNYDPRIIAFLSQYESKLMDFRPDHNEKTFCCPRTWEFMNRLCLGKEVTAARTPLFAGTITSGIAAEFVEFANIYTQLINVRDILRDPAGCPVPSNNSIRWATVSHMMEKVTEENFGDLSEYANRFPLDFRILFFRSTMVRHKKMRHHPAFSKAMVELSRYLN